MSLEVANDPLPPHRKIEDTAAGCRLLESGDRARAEEADSAHMRLRLISSADAWHARAALLEQMEDYRNRAIEAAPGEASGIGENGDG